MKKPVRFKFRLYVAGDGPHSALAIVNLNALCIQYLVGHYEIEVVDVLRDQRRALADRVLLTPLLVKLAPSPIRRIVGNLSNIAPVLQVLGLSNSNP